MAAPVGGLAVGPGGFQPPPAPAAAQQPGQQVPPRGRPGAQLYTTAANLLRDPQPADSPLPAPARRILPIVVQGGQFPVNPLTIYYIREQLTAEGLPSAGPIEPLIILDLEELEGCQALHQRRGTTLPRLLDAWRRSQYGGVAFRNYLAYEYGGKEIGRPQDVQAALEESFAIIQQLLGVDPRERWAPPDRAVPA